MKIKKELDRKEERLETNIEVLGETYEELKKNL
jgi:chaperonin cofactor prefoldin